MLDQPFIDGLFPESLPEPKYWEEHYAHRQLPEGAKVTRFGPSPTGFAHIGGIYLVAINRDISQRSGGRYLLRIEDTDQVREVEGALSQFDGAFNYFGLLPDEGGDRGDYGPYRQSAREDIYLSYVRQLLRENKAYLCFASKEELAENVKCQQESKLPTGYYGRWAIWRDADPAAVKAEVSKGSSYVVRFRSPGQEGARVRFSDAIRGTIEQEDNRNDAVILKSSERSPRLPTYHFAHAIDDHLMYVNLVIRGDEWISSVPLHLQLFDALGFEHVTYAHIAPLMKQIPGGKRKLSKRKDPEASIDFYIEAGYPAKAILYYLRGLANGRLAEMPLDEALNEPINIKEFGVAGPLVDLVKLEDISADHIATLSGEEILGAVHDWAARYDPALVEVLEAERELALSALAVEREGVENPRKDLRKWSDFRNSYGFFFPQLFELVEPDDERLGGLDRELVRALANDFIAIYRPLKDQQEWFQQIRALAAEHGFAPNVKEYKKNPDAYSGSIREASQMIRVALAGSTRSPDLFQVAHTLGEREVLRRMSSMTQLT